LHLALFSKETELGMFTGNLRRGRFLLYSIGLALADAALLLACIVVTTGFMELGDTKPSLFARGWLGLCVLAYSLPLGLWKANLGWRRANDAELNVVARWGYAFSLMSVALLTPGEMIYHNFQTHEGLDGFGMVGLSCFALWILHLIAPSKASGTGVDDEIAELSRRHGGADPGPAVPIALARSPSVTTFGNAPGPASFGRRR
jgi:hypothetical protein